MSPEGWADHSLIEVIFSTFPAFNVIDLAHLDVLANSVAGEECWCSVNEPVGARLLVRRFWKRTSRKEKEFEFTADVTAGKLYPRSCVPYFSAGNGNVFDDIQFTVMAAAVPRWHQWSDDRRLQLRRHLSVHWVFAYFSPNVLFISGAIFPCEIINFTSVGIKS